MSILPEDVCYRVGGSRFSSAKGALVFLTSDKSGETTCRRWGLDTAEPLRRPQRICRSKGMAFRFETRRGLPSGSGLAGEPLRRPQRLPAREGWDFASRLGGGCPPDLAWLVNLCGGRKGFTRSRGMRSRFEAGRGLPSGSCLAGEPLRRPQRLHHSRGMRSRFEVGRGLPFGSSLAGESLRRPQRSDSSR